MRGPRALTPEEEALGARWMSADELGVSAKPGPTEFTIITPENYWSYPPVARLLLLVDFSVRVFGEDEPGGWVALTSGKYERFHLADRYVRRRAVRTFERGSLGEVRRSQGVVTKVRRHPPTKPEMSVK
jgi:hypothetical protein